MLRTLRDPAPFSLQHDIPTSSSLLYPSNTRTPVHRNQDSCFAVLPNRALTGYEPNAPVEVNSTEVTTTLLPPRKASIGSTYSSGEDIVSFLAVSEVDERSDLGMLASPLSTQERDKCDPIQNLQELQDKVNSLSDFREFCDPKTASSSGLSHHPSHPITIPSPRGLLSRDSCLQLEKRNSCGMSGNVSENLPAPNEPSAPFFGNSRSLASAQCEPVSLNTGGVADPAEKERNTQHFAIPTPRFAREFSTWKPPSHAEGAYPQNSMVR